MDGSIRKLCNNLTMQGTTAISRQEALEKLQTRLNQHEIVDALPPAAFTLLFNRTLTLIIQERDDFCNKYLKDWRGSQDQTDVESHLASLPAQPTIAKLRTRLTSLARYFRSFLQAVDGSRYQTTDAVSHDLQPPTADDKPAVRVLTACVNEIMALALSASCFRLHIFEATALDCFKALNAYILPYSEYRDRLSDEVLRQAIQCVLINLDPDDFQGTTIRQIQVELARALPWLLDCLCSNVDTHAADVLSFLLRFFQAHQRRDTSLHMPLIKSLNVLMMYTAMNWCETRNHDLLLIADCISDLVHSKTPETRQQVIYFLRMVVGMARANDKDARLVFSGVFIKCWNSLKVDARTLFDAEWFEMVGVLRFRDGHLLPSDVTLMGTQRGTYDVLSLKFMNVAIEWISWSICNLMADLVHFLLVATPVSSGSQGTTILW